MTICWEKIQSAEYRHIQRQRNHQRSRRPLRRNGSFRRSQTNRQRLTRGWITRKVEDYDNKVGYSERTNVVIEPKLSMQWFVKMDKLAAPALDAVMKDEIKFHPDKFKTFIGTGWKTLKIGVSPASFGGDIASRHTTFRKADS